MKAGQKTGDIIKEDCDRVDLSVIFTLNFTGIMTG